MKAKFNQWIIAVVENMSKEKFLIGPSILRIVLGVIMLYNYFIHYFQRHLLFSHEGIGLFNANYSLYDLVKSPLQFDIIYHLAILITMLFIIGYGNRFITILNFIFYHSFYQRLSYMADGGDNLLYIVLFLLIFVNVTTYFSVDNVLYKRRGKPFKHSSWSIIIHNIFVVAIIIQMCIVYFTSACYQLMGEVWSNGTALYYISQVDAFSRPSLTYFVENFMYLSVLFSYLSIFIKLAFPFIILNKRLKLCAVLALCSFHFGILVGMGLLSFSMVMISMEFLIFTDQEYKKVFSLKESLKINVVRLIFSFKQKFGRKTPSQ
ncbi:Vitamin K-dependent gamma-carboxylase [Thermoactinomyces sp. DSM 45891]|uniref:HTTM domain-containing protein n=1 Tax=Thermoactinomyces sp. DSM 45891 TaxID=1761907 RepID=UPI00091A6A7F|nr:HTTM domain-containing protein [Thermoactinomyces sp. DSM 45891]SFX47986.1 Vitamin K-dependent gamma-carboxylase [Thermoactinomyces sp. DSM 45891]